MSKKSVLLSDHVIYGDWDDTYSHQVLVHYHPNSIHCTVFVMSGCDYGGGIETHFDALASVVQHLWNEATDCYSFYTAMRNGI